MAGAQSGHRMAIVRREAMRSSSMQRLTAPATYWCPPHKPIGSAVSFSPREREIARMLAKGYPNKTIADVLEISPWTVSTHLRRIFAKLRVSSRAAMAARCLPCPRSVACRRQSSFYLSVEAAPIHICNPNSKLLAGFNSPNTSAASRTVMPWRNAHKATAASGALVSPYTLATWPSMKRHDSRCTPFASASVVKGMSVRAKTCGFSRANLI